MRGEAWREVRIGDLGEVFTGRTPPTEHPELFGDDYPFVTPGDMRQGKYARATQRSVSHEGAEVLKRIKIPARSVCVSCIGWQMGEVIMTDKPSFTNQQINAIVPNGNVDSSFLYYSLRPRKQELLSLGAATGVRTPILNKSAFCNIKVKVPSLLEQRRIAGILSAYDELIENGQRRIRILEEMARAIYREWFVAFRFPGHENTPCVPSPLGSIPKDWEMKEMQEIADVIDCLHSKKPTECADGVGVLLQLNNIGEAGKLDMREKFRISAKDYALWTSRVELQAGDCVVTNVGRVGAIAQVPEGVRAAPGRNMTAIRPRAGQLTPTYLIEYLLSSHMASEVAKKKDLGTIMDSLNVKGIIRLHVPYPPMKVMLRFEAIARPIRKRIEVLMEQIQHLRRMRDLLLPQLLSGKK